jgi:outer membrane cobalamin receptor
MGQKITGVVNTHDLNEKTVTLPGVSLYFAGTTIGTTSDAEGKFSLSLKNVTSRKLVVSCVGYKTDTIEIEKPGHITIHLHEAASELGTVTIQGKVNGTFISQIDPHKVQVITGKELKRAACCNLSESFETSSSVDVMYSDAVSGAKQIQMLGLSGVYSQIISENVPLLRGLGATFGLGYIPGPWMSSISVSKGASSVINGFESTTGLINVEYKKPAESEKLFLNLFANHHGRLEANINSAVKLNNHLSTMMLGHFSTFNNPFDKNGDGFMDSPKLTTYNFINRWDYEIAEKFDSRFLIKYLDEIRTGGFMNFDPENYHPDIEKISNLNETYGLHLRTKRLESFWKNGIVLNEHRSVALIVSGIYHDQSGFMGQNQYNALQKSFNSNLLYQDVIAHNDHHRITAGLSYIYDDYRESYQRRNYTFLYQQLGVNDVIQPNDTLFTVHHFSDTTYNFDRIETVAGAYLEYSWTIFDDLTLISGARADYHNTYGLFITPRFHLRYKIAEKNMLRASAGKGYRTANLLSENFSIMASQRLIHLEPNLQQEEAWNYGISYTHDFKLAGRSAQLDLEYYRTDFIHQVIADLDSLPTDVFFYNLKGKSFANSYMIQLTAEPIKRLSLLAAFRVSDVRTTISNQLRQKPMTNAYKAIVSINYATKYEKWKFDITTQFNGKSRIPDTGKMPVALRRGNYSPAYAQLFAQVTRKFKHFELYAGGENLTNFTQKDPISEPFAPYHTHFDTSMVWGPLVGATVYTGFRLALN